MTRPLLVALGLIVASQTAPAQDLGDAISDFRERQYMTGMRIGCEIKAQKALMSEDPAELRAADALCRRAWGRKPPASSG